MSLETYLQNALLRLEEQTALLEQKTADFIKKTAEAQNTDALTGQLNATKALLAQQADEKTKLADEKNQLAEQKSAWEKERAALLEAKESLSADRLRLSAERDRLSGEKERLGQEKDAVIDGLRQKYGEEIKALSSQNSALSAQVIEDRKTADAFARQSAELAETKAALQTALAEKESLSIESDGLKRAYEELKLTAADVSARLDATVAELKALRGE